MESGSGQQSTRQNRNLMIAYTSFENVAKFRYLETTVTSKL